MARERRYDIGELRPPVKDRNGWLRADSFLTRAGVFLYRNPDGSIRRELRPPEEIFRADSLATLAMVPVTDGHPSVPLDATNARALSVGHIGENVQRADGDLVRAALILVDKPTIDAVERGDRRELSCGYEADIIEESGIYEGEPYDVVQRNVTYNHVAIVPMGRAGPLVRVRVDGEERLVPPSDGAVQVRSDSDDSKPESKGGVTSPPSQAQRADGGTMSTRRHRRYDLSLELTEGQIEILEAMLERAKAEATTQVDELKAKLDEAKKAQADAEGEVEEVKKDLEQAEKEAQEAQAKADQAESELKKLRADYAEATDPKKVRERISARVSLETAARRVLGETKLDELDDLAVKSAVVKKLDPEVKLDGRPPAYVDARFDAAMEAFDKSNPSLDALRRAAETSRQDAGDGAPRSRLDEANEALLKHNREAYRQPLRN